MSRASLPHNSFVGVGKFTPQYTDMAMGTTAYIFLVSVRCMTLSVKQKKSFSQNHMVFLTGNIRSLPTRNDVSNYRNFAASSAIYFLLFSREAYKHVSESKNSVGRSWQ